MGQCATKHDDTYSSHHHQPSTHPSSSPIYSTTAVKPNLTIAINDDHQLKPIATPQHQHQHQRHTPHHHHTTATTVAELQQLNADLTDRLLVRDNDITNLQHELEQLRQARLQSANGVLTQAMKILQPQLSTRSTMNHRTSIDQPQPHSPPPQLHITTAAPADDTALQSEHASPTTSYSDDADMAVRDDGKLRGELMQLLYTFAEHELQLNGVYNDELPLTAAITQSNLDETTKQWLTSEFIQQSAPTGEHRRGSVDKQDSDDSYALSSHHANTRSRMGTVLQRRAGGGGYGGNNGGHGDSTRSQSGSVDAGACGDKLLKPVNPIRFEAEFGTYNFDVFELTAPELQYYAIKMYTEFDLINRFRLSTTALNTFITAANAGYKAENSYHNWYHAVDIMHVLYTYLKNSDIVVLTQMRSLDVFTLLTAGICHDIGHTGTTNAYLVNTQHDLAVTYNDQSVLENMHASTAWRLLVQHNVLEPLSPTERLDFRKQFIQCIYATDMTHHFEMVGKLDGLFDRLDACVQQQQAAQVNQQQPNSVLSPLHRTKRMTMLPHQPLLSTPNNATMSAQQQPTQPMVARDDINLLMQVLLHCADVSNVTKPYRLAVQWSERVQTEFFMQGDQERASGSAISPFCDRHNENHNFLPSMTINFIDFIVAPLICVIVQAYKTLRPIAQNLVDNRQIYHLAVHERLEQAIAAAAVDTVKQAKQAEQQSLMSRHQRFIATFAEPVLGASHSSSDNNTDSTATASAPSANTAAGSGGQADNNSLSVTQPIVMTQTPRSQSAGQTHRAARRQTWHNVKASISNVAMISMPAISESSNTRGGQQQTQQQAQAAQPSTDQVSEDQMASVKSGRAGGYVRTRARMASDMSSRMSMSSMRRSLVDGSGIVVTIDKTDVEMMDALHAATDMVLNAAAKRRQSLDSVDSSAAMLAVQHAGGGNSGSNSRRVSMRRHNSRMSVSVARQLMMLDGGGGGGRASGVVVDNNGVHHNLSMTAPTNALQAALMQHSNGELKEKMALAGLLRRKSSVTAVLPVNTYTG